MTVVSKPDRPTAQTGDRPGPPPATRPDPADPTDVHPAVPFVAPSDGCHTVWLPPRCTAAVVMVDMPADPERGVKATVVPHYRVTPAVYAWVRDRLVRVEDQAYQVMPRGTAPADPDALRQPEDDVANRQAVRAALAVAGERWAAVAAWAEAAYSAAALAGARPALPRAEKVPEVARCR